MWALTDENSIVHFKLAKVDKLFLNTSIRWAQLLEFFKEYSVILLLVYMVAAIALSYGIAKDSISSRALPIAINSAWLFEHQLSSLSFIWASSSLPTNIATPERTQCSFLVPSIYVHIICSSCPFAS